MLFTGLKSQERPKLIVGLVVDQMTNDYLYRFGKDFGPEGFNRLMQDGFYFPNTFYNYMRTSTGPGHASIYTGSYPSLHGIVENQWHSKDASSEMIYCVEDESVRRVDASGISDSGLASPKNLNGPTITDMLSLASGRKSKVIGIALKDRGAILPAGHIANLAIWWDSTWVTSTYYTSEFPVWLRDFELKSPASSYLKKWELSENHRVNNSDQNLSREEVEVGFGKNNQTQFPYDLPSLKNDEGIDILKSTPFGNTMTFDLGREAIESENMGMDQMPDFLCLSFSSTDYIGHRFGPLSDEVKDTYLKFDRDLAQFLKFLDDKVGRGQYLLFLTSDHGVVPNVNYLKSVGFENADHFDDSTLKVLLNRHLLKNFKIENAVLDIQNSQVYLDRKVVSLQDARMESILESVKKYLLSHPQIDMALSSRDLLFNEYEDFPKKQMQNSFFFKRSGDLIFIRKPFMRSVKYQKGTGHGSVYNYDRNVPLIFYGWGVDSGLSHADVEITQIASTLADLLKIQRPPQCNAASLYDLITDQVR